MLKVCCTCKKTLCNSCFCKNKNNADKLSSQCRKCAKIYREKNKNKKYKSTLLENRREYYNNNKQHINGLKRQNRSSNSELREKDINRSKEYYKNNKKELQYKMKLYYQNNKESIKLYQKKYREENKEYLLQKNRARSLKITNTINQVDIDNLISNYNSMCAYCGILVVKGNNLHIDHVTPLSREGAHNINNLVPSCQTCNLQKGSKTGLEFILSKLEDKKYVY